MHQERWREFELIQIASAKANEPGKLFDALHYFGQASNRGVDDEKGFTKVANEVLYEAEQAEKVIIYQH